MSLRSNRVAEQMKKEIGEIITRKIKDPRVGFVTVTDVDVTGDLQQATVYITSLGSERERAETLKALEKLQALSDQKSVLAFAYAAHQKFPLNSTLQWNMEIKLMNCFVLYMKTNKKKPAAICCGFSYSGKQY